MIQRIFYIIIFTCFFFGIGCKEDSIIQEVPIPQLTDTIYIQPLTVGSVWNYIDISFYRNGIVRDTINEIRSYGIKRDTIINGFIMAMYISLPECDDCGFTEWLSNQKDGLWDGIPNWGWLRLPYPSKPGVKATGRYAEWWVVSTNETITVPAGTFSCYHYKVRSLDRWSSGITNDLYYAPGVGMVRSDWYTFLTDTTSYKYIQRNLVSYTIE